MLGLVLEGGGAKGAFHLGAIKALTDNGYTFNGVTGTSIGAINGAFVAQNDIPLCYELWQNMLPSMILDVEDEQIANLINRKLDKNTLKYFFNLAKSTLSNRGFSTDKAFEFLKKYINEDKLRSSKIDYGIVTVSITDKYTPIEIFKEEMPYGMLHDYIFASAYYPAFKRQDLNGKKFMDGGIYDNLPINPLIRKGYTDIFAIHTGSIMPHQRVIDTTVNITHIKPTESLGRAMTFTNESVNHKLKLGYYDTIKALRNYQGDYFYFENITDEQFYALLVPYLTETIWGRLILELKAPTINKAAVLNLMIESIRADLKLSDNLSLYGVFITLIQKYADPTSIEKFFVYDIITFLELIKDNYVYKKDGFFSFIKDKVLDSKSNDIIKILLEENNEKI